jgi:exodeoxyribonuclease VII small subunit
MSSNQSSPNLTEAKISPDWNYEATVAKVEEILSQIESGELELAEVFEQFVTAVKYLDQCETFLEERRQQVELIVEQLADN